jgi:hypothetical protein
MSPGQRQGVISAQVSSSLSSQMNIINGFESFAEDFDGCIKPHTEAG